MIKAAALLDVKVVVTEQNPRGPSFLLPRCRMNEEDADYHIWRTALGATVPLPFEALKQGSMINIAKTKFSMVLPEVEAKLVEWEIKSVVIFGIEVRILTLRYSLDNLIDAMCHTEPCMCPADRTGFTRTRILSPYSPRRCELLQPRRGSRSIG